MEDSTPNNREELHEYTILGRGLTTLQIQPGFVEDCTEKHRSYPTLENMYRRTLSQTKEFTLIIWNGIPFRLSYTEDIPFLIKPLIKTLQNLITNSVDLWEMNFQSSNYHMMWQFEVNPNQIITITGRFDKVSGGLENALNAINSIRCDKNHFLRECKLLIEQMIQLFKAFGNKIKNPEDYALLQTLSELNKKITKRSDRYQYNLRD